MNIKTIKEKSHRLAHEFYIGDFSVSFTLCLKNKIDLFIEPEIVNTFTNLLSLIIENKDCIIPLYCFMPDHLHLIIKGNNKESDLINALISYKQKTGYWMKQNLKTGCWQKDFYDHIIKKDQELATHVRYILNNPVRKGLVVDWKEYTFKGTLGCKLEDVLNEML